MDSSIPLALSLVRNFDLLEAENGRNRSRNNEVSCPINLLSWFQIHLSAAGMVMKSERETGVGDHRYCRSISEWNGTPTGTCER